MRNRGPLPSNRLGVKGVGYRATRLGKKKYYAQINHQGKYTWIGWFETVEEATFAYETKAKELHKNFFYNGSVAA